jgi:hypothetical protein
VVALSDLYSIEVIYTTRDRFGDARHHDPHIAYVQRVDAEIEGLAAADEGSADDELRVRLGSVSLARVDLWEVGRAYMDVLDSIRPSGPPTTRSSRPRRKNFRISC